MGSLPLTAGLRRARRNLGRAREGYPVHPAAFSGVSGSQVEIAGAPGAGVPAARDQVGQVRRLVAGSRGRKAQPAEGGGLALRCFQWVPEFARLARTGVENALLGISATAEAEGGIV
jgi:hypothetical protein